jgi:hypothetical protein
MDSEKLTAATLGGALPAQPVTIVHYAQAAPDTLVLRAVRKGSPCFCTIRTTAGIHLFQLNAAEEANLAVVIDDGARSGGGVVRSVQQKDVLASRRKYSGTELISILSKARQRVFLEAVSPDLYTDWQQRSFLSLTYHNGPLISTITEAQRWPQKDAVILRSKVTNTSPVTQYFNPSDVKVRIADRTYTVQLADSSGNVPPGQEVLLDVICQGDGTGSQEHLSIDNDFRLELSASTTPPSYSPMLEPNPLFPTVEEPAGATLIAPVPTAADMGSESHIPLPNFYPSSK